MLTKLIALRVPVETYDKLRESCADQDISVSEAVRQQIDSYLSSTGKGTAPAAAPPEAAGGPATAPAAASPSIVPAGTEPTEAEAGQLVTILSELNEQLGRLKQTQSQHEELLEELMEQREAQRTVEADDEPDEDDPDTSDSDQAESHEQDGQARSSPVAEAVQFFSPLFEPDDAEAGQ